MVLEFATVTQGPSATRPFGTLQVLDPEGNPFRREHEFSEATGSFVTTTTGSIPIWVGPTIKQKGEELRVNPPSRGIRLVIQRVKVDGKHHITRWGYAAGFEDAARALCCKNEHRVVICDKRTEELNHGLIWEGRDIHELSVRYPRAFDGHPDELWFGEAHLGHRFEMKRGGIWRRSRRDPRIELCCVPREEFRALNARRPEPFMRQPSCIHRRQVAA